MMHDGNALEPLPVLLWRAHRMMSARFRTTVSQFDLTEQQFRAIHIISQGHQMSARAMAHRADVTLSSLSRILRDLNERGLIRRIDSMEDGRTSQAVLTAAGRRLLDRTMKDVNAVYASLEDEIGRELIVELSRSLNKVIRRLAEPAAKKAV